MNSAEFALRENNTGSFPRGMALMFRTMRTWLHGGDPLEPLTFEAPLAAIKADLAAGEPVFETLIRDAPARQPAPHHRAAQGRHRARPRRKPRRSGRGSMPCAAWLDADALKAVEEQTSEAQGAAGGGRSARGAGQDPDADARGPAADQQADPDRARHARRRAAVHPRRCRPTASSISTSASTCGALPARPRAVPAALLARAARRPARRRKISSR